LIDLAQIVLKTEGIKGTCIICNCYPRDETKEGHVYLPMFHAVGVDINWGEDCNICQVCAGVMADMMGRVDAGRHEKLVTQHEDLQESFVTLQEQFDEQKARIKRILEGRKAAKEQKAA
jgi:hypothetical protein